MWNTKLSTPPTPYSQSARPPRPSEISPRGAPDLVSGDRNGPKKRKPQRSQKSQRKKNHQTPLCPPRPLRLKKGPFSRSFLLPGLDQCLGLRLVGLHDQISALARFAHIVRSQRKPHSLGRPATARQAQMTPPSAVVVPNVMVRPVFPVRQFNKFVLHNEKVHFDPSRARRQPDMTLKNRPCSVAACHADRRVPGDGRSSSLVAALFECRIPFS